MLTRGASLPIVRSSGGVEEGARAEKGALQPFLTEACTPSLCPPLPSVTVSSAPLQPTVTGTGVLLGVHTEVGWTVSQLYRYDTEAEVEVYRYRSPQGPKYTGGLLI